MIEDKKGSNIRLGLAFLSGLSLFALYLYFMSYFSGSILLGPMDAVQSAIFFTMILRVGALWFVPYLRRVYPQVKIVMLSFEAFILFLLVLVEVLTASSTDSQLMADVLTAWLVSALIIVTPYSIFELAIMMYKGTSITSLAVYSGPLSAICLFLSNFVARVPAPPIGIRDFGVTIIDSLKASPSFAGSGLGTENSFLSEASVFFFLSIILYIAFHLNESATDFTQMPKYHYALSLMLLGSLISYLWLLASSSLLDENVFEILSLPAAVIPIILWVFARER